MIWGRQGMGRARLNGMKVVACLVATVVLAGGWPVPARAVAATTGGISLSPAVAPMAGGSDSGELDPSEPPPPPDAVADVTVAASTDAGEQLVTVSQPT